MTITLTFHHRLASRISLSQRFQSGLRAMSACALAALAITPAQAQLIEGWNPGSGNVVGTAAAAPPEHYSEGIPGGYATPDDVGVYVGPGGVTSSTSVPSALGPASVPAQTRYVNQPFPSGPFVQNQPVYQESPQGMSFACDVGCDIGYYGSAEALYFRRDHDERFTLSRGNRMPPFDYELGGRVTVGRLFDCVNGIEASYAGPFEWERQRAQNGVDLDSNLTVVGYLPSVVDSFNDATFHSQITEARLNTYEVNRRWFAWDIFSTLIGIRVVDYREEYAFLSINPLAGNGLLQDETRNLMVGPQIGGDYMMPVGLRTLVGFKGKGALLANFNRNEILLQNAGSTILDAADSDVDFAGLIEFGGFVKYSITPSIRLTAGYEVWYIPEVATVPGQNVNLVSPDSGIKVFADEELLLHGASAGAQILF